MTHGAWGRVLEVPGVQAEMIGMESFWNKNVNGLPGEFVEVVAKDGCDLGIGVQNISFVIGHDHGIGRGRGD